MGKASIEDTIIDHPKFDGIGGDAGWFWLAGLLWSRRTLTDGFIPASRITALVPGQRAPQRIAALLVERRLWEVVPDGYQIHDFFDHNPSKAQVRFYQQRDRDRKQRHFATDSMSDSRSDSTMESMSDSRSDSSLESRSDSSWSGLRVRARAAKSKSESKSESQSALSGGSEKSARETTALAFDRPRQRPRGGLMASHALCPAGTWGGCAGGICVPPKLAEEWYARLGGDRDAAEAHIRAMVDAAMAEVQRTGAVPGDKPYDFWRAVWAATHAAQAPTAPSRDSKGHATMSALSEALAARRQS